MPAVKTISRASRSKGALMGAFIGDALALGPHWYYDLDELRRYYGAWIDGYTEPRAGHYHAGLHAGDSSQAGFILDLLLHSLVERGEYDEVDFCRRLDQTLFPLLDGTPKAGPGGYTSESMRHAWRQRKAGRPWGQVASLADNTEAAERVLALAVRHAHDLPELARTVSANVALTQCDSTVAAMTLAYAVVLAELVNGTPLDGELSGRLMRLVHEGRLPFHAVTDVGLKPPAGAEPPLLAGQFPSPDALLTVSAIARAVQDPGVRIEPASKVGLVYGLPCAVYHQFPAVYYLAARFQCDFEQGVLAAVNAGGQNQARAILTGALCGAIGGFEAIPQRFVDGLARGREYLQRVDALVAQLPAD